MAHRRARGVVQTKEVTRGHRQNEAGPVDPNPAAAPNAATAVPAPTETELEALVLTHCFDAGAGTEPYSATIRLTGHRLGVQGIRRSVDSFVHEETIEGVVPESGSVSVSSRIYGLNPGEWTVSGELYRDAGPSLHRTHTRIRPEPLASASWSWRKWTVEEAKPVPAKTRWALTTPLARIPGIIPGSYPALFALGVAVALALQLAILATIQIAFPRSAMVSLLALTGGLIGAKLWYAVLHPGERILKAGWAVDGFLVSAPLVAVTALVLFGLPIGAFLDAAAPGLFFAVAIGRVGCFLSGCCAGRLTGSHWGIWSSDQRVGARRIPTQLIESGAGLVIGGVSLPLVLLHIRPLHGAVFLVALAAYLAVRQLLLHLRAEPRRYLWARSESAAGHA